PLLRLPHKTSRLSRQLDAGLRSESEPADVVVEVGVLETQADLDGADVARVLEDLGGAEDAERLVIAYRRSAHTYRSHLAVEQIAGMDQVLLERRGHRDDLECRAGLVGVDDRAVLASLRLRLAGPVRVVGRLVGQRQDVAVVRIHDDDAAAGRAG